MRIDFLLKGIYDEWVRESPDWKYLAALGVEAAHRLELVCTLMNDHDVLNDHAVVYPNKLYNALNGVRHAS